MTTILDPKIPPGPLEGKWTRYRSESHLIGPVNRRKYTVLVVGTGLAGTAAAASLGELGYHVKAFCIQDSPRRAHGIAAQGGINATKNYPNDGDSIDRLFHDTVKGGDFRSREANVYRLAEISNRIIDHCVAQGVPFAREYSGYLANRSFGGVLVSRTFYARGQTGQQLLMGAYGSMMRQISLGTVELHTRCEMLDLVVADGKAKGIVVRDVITGCVASYAGDAVVLATGGYANVFFLSTNAKSSNVTAVWRTHRRGAFFANPCYTQIHPTCIPAHGQYQSKLTLMSESLRNDGRLWVPLKKGDNRPPNDIPENERDYYLDRQYPTFGNLVPRDVASRAAKEQCDQGKGVGVTGRAVYLDLSEAIRRLGVAAIRDRYGNIFEMYERITARDPYKEPMMIYPANHYTMGGLWVDYSLMSNLPGLFVIGEANFSDHGANRLGASALMQGLGDGYFILPYTIAPYLAGEKPGAVTVEHPAFAEARAQVNEMLQKLLSIRGRRSVDDMHRQLGLLLWDRCGMVRDEVGLNDALAQIRRLREEFWSNAAVPGSAESFNQTLVKAAQLADYLEFAELMVIDALHRDESCGAHFRQEYQMEDGEPRRDDQNFGYVAAWEFKDVGRAVLHKEPLRFETLKPSKRSYK
jgi:succinate dehydrogenase / fumarate reductase, flavoprotein subunit